MKVINVSGIPFRFERNGKVIMVPFDRRVHEIPDECVNDDFRGFLKVLEVPRNVNPPNIIEISLGTDEIKDENKKPLSGVKLKPKKREQLRKTRNTRPDKAKKVPEEVLTKEE